MHIGCLSTTLNHVPRTPSSAATVREAYGSEGMELEAAAVDEPSRGGGQPQSSEQGAWQCKGMLEQLRRHVPPRSLGCSN